MTDEEKLAAMSKALAAAENDPLQPACVMRAFLDTESPLVFGIELPQVTLRAWLSLERAGSPYVTGAPQPEKIEDRVQCLCTAIATISGKPLFAEAVIGSVPAEEVLKAEAAVAWRCGTAFETFLPLRNPEKKETTSKDPGTGWWVRLVARLMSDLNMSLASAMDTPISVAFALLAAYGTTEGMEVVGESWREREALNNFEQEVARG